MKKRHSKLAIIILILFISIGFAVLTSSLSINSNITFLPQRFNIYFDNLQVNELSSNTDMPTLNSDNKSVSFSTTINEPGDFYEFTFDVINDGTMDAALTEIVKSGLTETQAKYLNYTARYYGERDIKVDDILHAGYKEKVVVRVEYKYDIEEVVNMGTINFNFGLNYIKRDLQKDYGEETWSIDYTGSEHTFTVPKTGIYKLETWGAQGADGINEDIELVGGYGGYSTGTIKLTKNNNYYINIGGKGKAIKVKNNNLETIENGLAYNGGGWGASRTATFQQNYGLVLGLASGYGGGVTHISSTTGKLSELSDNKQSIYIVGAGGGASMTYTYNELHKMSYPKYSGYGGSGGGYIGNNASDFDSSHYCWGQGGTQESGGIAKQGSSPGADCTSTNLNGNFGQGGGIYDSSSSSIAGGGSGYYGGSASMHGAGAGGSGYIGNTNLTNKIMYCYNCQESTGEADETNIKTRSTTNVSEEPISNYAKIGNGFARITYLGNYTNKSNTVINYHANGGQGSMDTQVITENANLLENKYKRKGYTFVGWSTTEKELSNLISSIVAESNFIDNGDNTYTFDLSQNKIDTYLKQFYTESLVKETNYTLLFNLKHYESNEATYFGYPVENSNIITLEKGLNKISFNTWDDSNSARTYGFIDDRYRNDTNNSKGTMYNFFLYKDSEINYTDKASITFNSNTKTIDLYALWAKVES